jgi:hypothetical protein
MFQSGISGNPAGRPRKANSITQMMREYGDGVDVEGGPTRAQALAAVMWKAALDGDRQIAMYLIDRQDGKPKERVEHSESQVLRVMLDDGSDDDKGTSEAEAVHNQPG